jgi:hypothetical protein
MAIKKKLKNMPKSSDQNLGDFKNFFFLEMWRFYFFGKVPLTMLLGHFFFK